MSVFVDIVPLSIGFSLKGRLSLLLFLEIFAVRDSVILQSGKKQIRFVSADVCD